MATRTKPLPKKERLLTGRELNRGLQRGRGSETNQRKDTTQNVSVGLMDVDAAIMYYFNEVIKPTIEKGFDFRNLKWEDVGENQDTTGLNDS